MTRDIPFVAKRPLGPRPWLEFGGSRAFYEKWAPHVCGIACCRSLILASKGCAPSLSVLTERAVQLGAYVERPDGILGAYHVPLISLLAEYNIYATLLRQADEEKLWNIAESAIVMLSINLSSFDRSISGSHLVLVTHRDAPGYNVLDNARILDDAGNAIVPRHQMQCLSNGKGLVVSID